MTDPLYSHEHTRLRAELIARGDWVGKPCFHCHEPLWVGQKLALGHASDENGYSIPGHYVGLTHWVCENRTGASVNPWGIRQRAAQARANRSPERKRALADQEARRERKQFQAEFNRAQKESDGG